MRTTVFAPRRRTLLLSIIVVAVSSLVASSVYANTRTGDGGDLPCYARIEGGYVVHTDEWAAIAFYRPPDCVPRDFNLLDFYDWEHAFDCKPPNTDGFIIWQGEPGSSAPTQIKLHGLGAVPVWFVAWPYLKAGLADEVLTMTELEAMSPLEGSASFYNGTLHPDGGAKVPMINQVAHGLLEDGRSFQVHATFVTTVGIPRAYASSLSERDRR